MVAKEVSSPLTSLDVHILGSNAKDGKYSASWIWDLDFALSPSADGVESGDFFKFTVDPRANVPGHSFGVNDQSGNKIMQVQSSGNVFTATYTDGVTGKSDLSGDFFFESPFDKSKLGDNAETIDVTVKSGSQTLSDTITIDPSINVNDVSVYGQRKDDLIAWNVLLPLQPWDRLEFRATLTDEDSRFPGIYFIRDNTVMFYFYEVDDFGTPKISEEVEVIPDHFSNPTGAQYHFIGRVFNVPNNRTMNVVVDFPSEIKNIVDVFHLNVEWTTWSEPDTNEATRWTGGDKTGSGTGAAAYLCDACIPEGGGSATAESEY